MSDLTVSVIVVSRGRPQALKRCLIGISQLQYPGFEVVVVTDPGGHQATQDLTFASDLKLVAFDEANISAARNLGISHSAGEIVAFIDDDAVPEPQWLRYLVAPATQSDVVAMGGYVRGRNGISFQWKARTVGPDGFAESLEIDPNKAIVLHPTEARAIKTEGTNMAFRRRELIKLGGFDPAYRYFLDETDLNIRLARAGHATALVPLAEVHHGFEANVVRDANRAPKDLFEIGASWAVFQRKHLAEERHLSHWRDLRAHQRRRVLNHMVAGRVEPGAVRQLIRTFDLGYAEGQSRPLTKPKFALHPAEPFKPFPVRSRKAVVMPSRPWRLRKDLKIAAKKVKNGEIVTVISLSPTALFHKVSYDPRGIWLQRGGTFGKSIRNGPMFKMTTRSRRVEKETLRVARQRGLGDNGQNIDPEKP